MADTQRTAVITGASSGLGLETAKALAADGWRIIGVGRDTGRSAEGEAAIRAVSTTGDVTMLRGDLSLFAEAERLAGEIAALTPRIDVLVNNAGGMCRERVVTAEGNEQNFAGNHLGPFLLTDRLLPILRKTAAGEASGSVRILNTSSDASEMTPGMDFDDLQMLNGDFNAGFAYCRGKLANVLFTRGLAKRVDGDGIAVHAIHPGPVATNFASHATAQSQASIAKLDRLTPAQGADTIIWLATADEAAQSNGGYWYERKPKTPNPVADDDAYVERMWNETVKIVEKAGF